MNRNSSSWNWIRLSHSKKRVDISPNTIRKWERQGYLTIYRVGKLAFFCRSELDQCIKTKHEDAIRKAEEEMKERLSCGELVRVSPAFIRDYEKLGAKFYKVGEEICVDWRDEQKLQEEVSLRLMKRYGRKLTLEELICEGERLRRRIAGAALGFDPETTSPG